MDISGLFARDINPELARLARYACELAGDAPMAYRSRFQPQHITDVLCDVFLIEVMAEQNDYYFSLFGSRIATLYGADLSDMRLSQVGDAALRQSLRQTYDRVVCTHLPLYMRGRYVWPDKSIAIERLLLPMADNEDSMNAICGISRSVSVADEDLEYHVGNAPAQPIGEDELILSAA